MFLCCRQKKPPSWLRRYLPGWHHRAGAWSRSSLFSQEVCGFAELCVASFAHTPARLTTTIICAPAVMLAQRFGASQIQASTAAVCPRRHSAQAGTAGWTATATTWPTCRLLPSLCAEDSQTTERSRKVEFSLEKHTLCVVRAIAYNAVCVL